MTESLNNTEPGNGNEKALSDEILSSPGISVKLKKYTLTKDAQLQLLKCAREFDAHSANHGKKDKAFERVRDHFMAKLYALWFVKHQKPSVNHYATN